MEEHIGVIGAGSWGTTLAHLLAEKGFSVSLWVYEKDLAETIQKTKENTLYLPGFSLSERIMPSGNIEEVIRHRSLLVMVVPSHVYRSVALQMVPHLQENAVIVSATKGIENETLLTMSGIWKEILPESLGIRVVTLAGPSFAREVMQKTPTAVTVAAEDRETARKVQHVFHTPYFRVYTSPDKVGVELAGALKNVIAIAAGVCDGLGYGLNTRAALITRGLAEITRLGVRMGAHPLTFAGLSGIGDLLLTCTGDLSRNRTVGFRLGRGETLQEILADMRMVAEGIRTCTSVYELAKKLHVDMPICEQMYQILHENKNPRQAVWDLMERDLKSELEFPLP
ncbi:NAD(P)H-dependent glycerol-3-phosphate dehydrogenase [Desulfosoma caldarium]|uniref:NAD(P)H-dependent glycerol-3-phosphate dehydrogenase n=1 Tax=Desulfosoma caldarium TaxID=610254 RepID=UPI000F47C0A3